MEHSVQGYLKRQSTYKLEEILQQCQQNQEMYGYVIPLVQAILAERQVDSQFSKNTEHK